MSELLYQVRLDVTEDIAEEVRNKNYYKLNEYIDAILLKVDAELICQFDAFNNFVIECEKENNTNNALYKWTKDTIENRLKKNKYLKSFTVYVNGEQLYEKKIADYLEIEIKKLNEKRILKISKYNSDPKNNPQPPKKYF
jgi:S-adenosylmethionine hydrolase